MPKISVIMSIYKEPVEWIKQSIESILNQTFPDFEFIIVNDKPDRDENRVLLQEYCDRDKRIRVIHNSDNIGLTKSLNRALAIAVGQYIARMDADDISMPKRFEKQVAFMETHQSVIVLGTGFKFFGKGSTLKKTGQKYDNASIKAQMLLLNCLAHSSVFIRKEVLDKAGLKYDESYRQSQDYRLWEQLSPFGDFACVRENLLRYRLSPQQITKTQGKGQSNLANSVRQRLQKHWLNENGYVYAPEIISSHPFTIIRELRTDKRVNRSKEYSAFLQYAYLYSGDETWTLGSFLRYDIKMMPFFGVLRVIRRLL